ncbi:MAG: hypothetical protein ACHQ1F_06395 [Spirochaetia bacterium]
MSRVQFITHKGKRILYFDLSSCKVAEISAVVAEAKRAVASQPPASVLALTNVTETELSKSSSAIIKDFTAHNKPFIKASAVVGVEGLRKVIYNAAMAFSGRTISAFDTLEQAKDWLSTQ